MNSKQVQILIIDDDPGILEALKAIFEFQGWSVYTVNRVRNALLYLQNKPCDLIMIDYHMPEINGVQGVRMIRAEFPTIPILALTVTDNKQIVDQFRDAGITDFVLKPIKAPDIISRIKLHLQLIRNAKKEENTKGIVNSTLVQIRNYLKGQNDFVTSVQISEDLNMAYPTVYRYIKYMIEQDEIQVQTLYGKVGRPKQSYALKS